MPLDDEKGPKTRGELEECAGPDIPCRLAGVRTLQKSPVSANGSFSRTEVPPPEVEVARGFRGFPRRHHLWIM